MDTLVSSDNLGCKLFVGGVPIKIDESRLLSHFEQFGQIKLFKLARHKKTRDILGFAFVEYEDTYSAMKALATDHFIDTREVAWCLL
jgi:RNA recognition motif-containing protein